jgi:hypothetical protein
VRVTGDGPSVAEQFAHTAGFFENYHIPIGHPGLNRLLRENGEWEELSSGVSYGVFVLKDKPSKVDEERELRRLNLHINDLVNEQDRQICLRVQQDLRR